ncbi:MAG: OmpA family protein [Alphaproteobacteria bacterium]|nr:OmpA family protein [Alphaproteobacteria bacterium]
MTSFSAKTAALTVAIALGSLMSTSAHAAILRSSNGSPVLTSQGGCVVTDWAGGQECAAAKAMAGLPSEVAMPMVERAATVFFGFNSTALTPKGKHELNKLVWKICHHEHAMWKNCRKHHRHMTRAEVVAMREKAEPNIIVVGYSDRLGNAHYNETLALRRAKAVRAYLVSRGILSKKIEVRSLGKTEPMANCPAEMARVKLISCLHEDRRVEVDIIR